MELPGRKYVLIFVLGSVFSVFISCMVCIMLCRGLKAHEACLNVIFEDCTNKSHVKMFNDVQEIPGHATEYSDFCKEDNGMRDQNLMNQVKCYESLNQPFYRVRM